MKLNEHFIKHTIDGRTVLVPTAEAPFHGLIEGNKSVAAILDCLERGATEEEIVAELKARFNGNESEIREDVTDVLAKLRAIGAIDD